MRVHEQLFNLRAYLVVSASLLRAEPLRLTVKQLTGLGGEQEVEPNTVARLNHCATAALLCAVEPRPSHQLTHGLRLLSTE